VKFGATVEGLAEAILGAERMPPLAREVARVETVSTAGTVAARARQLVPVDEGNLQATIRVVKSPTGKAIASVAAGNNRRGADGVPYAVKIHEDLSLRHQNGQAKFIEVPSLAEAQGYGDRLDKAVGDLAERVL
jgi:hypothetical protein